MTKAIVFLGTSSIGALYLKNTLSQWDMVPIFLLHLADYSGEPRAAIERERHFEADVTSASDVINVINTQQLLEHYDVRGITSFLDETFPVVLDVAHQLELRGPDRALRVLSDKAQALQYVPEFCPPSMQFCQGTLDATALKEFYESHPSDEFVLKPAISSGAVGITVVEQGTPLDMLKKQMATFVVEDQAAATWLLQPRIAGRLHSLEGFVDDGEITLFGFSRRTRQQLTEVANEYPVDTDITADIQSQCQAAVMALVQRSGYRHGYLHCEFILNETRAYLIDPNMGRLSGGAFVQHCGLYHQLSPERILQHVIGLGLSLNDVPTPEYRETSGSDQRRTVAIHYGIATTAKIQQIALPSDLLSRHTQLASNERVTEAVGTSDSSWVGFIAGWKEDVIRDIAGVKITAADGRALKPCYTLSEPGYAMNYGGGGASTFQPPSGNDSVMMKATCCD